MEYILALLLLTFIGLVVVVVVQYRKDLKDRKKRFAKTQPKKCEYPTMGIA